MPSRQDYLRKRFGLSRKTALFDITQTCLIYVPYKQDYDITINDIFRTLGYKRRGKYPDQMKILDRWTPSSDDLHDQLDGCIFLVHKLMFGDRGYCYQGRLSSALMTDRL